MPDHVTLDVVDRPRSGVAALARTLIRLRRSRPHGLRAVIPLGTSRFDEMRLPLPHLTPRRIGVLAVWDAGADVDAGWSRALGTAVAGAQEHWHVAGEVARASFTEPWGGWNPDTGDATPLDPDEPALILISGTLRARYMPAFQADAVHTINQAIGQPGYLGGLGLASSPLNTTSCSAWRSYRDARAYAYRPGAHASAMRRDRVGEHHRTEWFMGVRPVGERGTLDGHAPLASLLAGRRAAAV